MKVPKRGHRAKPPKEGDTLVQMNCKIWKSQRDLLNNLRPNLGYHIRKALVAYLRRNPNLKMEEWNFDLDLLQNHT